MTGRSGTVAVEYALLLPALLVFVLGIVDTGRLLWTQITLEHAVEAASRCSAIDTTLCSTAAKTQSYAVTQAYGLTVTTSNFTVSTPSCGTTVKASVPFVLIIPYLTTTSLTLTATSCYPL
jgi:Flp pilus assembly protein TadG